MARVRSRKALGIVVALGLAAAAGATTLTLIGQDGDNGTLPSDGSDLTTTAIEQRPLAEYLEVAGTLEYSGSVTLIAQTSGVLIDLAAEGSVVARGEQLYQIINEPTEANTADVLSRLAAARNSLVAARDELSDALSGPSESDIAAAGAALTDALEARDRQVEPPSEAEIASAEAAVATASEALDDLLDPSPAARSEARSKLSAARSDLADLLAGASQADVDSARAAVLAAQTDFDDLRAGASQAEVDAARASLLAAEEALEGMDASEAAIEAAEADLALARQALTDLQAGPTEAEIAAARAAVLVAEDEADAYIYYPDLHPESVSAEADLALERQALADLLAGASEAELDAAEAAVSSAAEALADLLAGASEAELDAAEAAAEAASEALEDLENPTEGARAAARANLATAREALADLPAEPTAAEVDLAESAVLAAEEALADLVAGASPSEIEALEASVASAEASVASAEADLAALSAGRGGLAVMYGSTAAYRTMTVGVEGDDVLQLEGNLADLGYTDSEGFSVDGVFDDATAAAVSGWQRATGQNPDGTVGVADVVFVAGPVRVGSWAQGVEVGQLLTAGASLASLTVIEAPVDGRMSTTQRVVAMVPLSDRDLVSEGIAVNVELPDGTDIGGAVTAINPSPVFDDQTGENAVEVTILLAEPASEVWIGATVDVEITETLIQDALVVPATALLALVEGGYAVEAVAEDGSVRLIGVEIGLFVDGDVEVRSPELSAGIRVVVPR
jgi:multidrug efflux pump subunit AcrA (membrane-fusion protein)